MPTTSEDQGQWIDVLKEDRFYDLEYDDFITTKLDAMPWVVIKEDPVGNVLSAAWEPLISLIPRFRYLTDFIYSCASEYPPSLARTLHQHHPSCRLDMRKVKFSPLIDPTRNPDEVELATSPCLHALAIAINDVPLPRGDLSSDDVLHIMSGLAPNLKKVRVHQLAAGDEAFGPVRKVSVPITHGPKLGAITSLSLFNFTFNTEHIELFALHTDLGKLQTLAFRPTYFALLKAARERLFPSLQRLGISGTITLDQDPDPRIGSGASVFLESLNPLSTLMITDNIVDEPLFNIILTRHGPSLRELRISTEKLIFSAEHIIQIRDSCPLLENLDIQIKRTQSDARERRLYETLGTLPRLKKLTLNTFESLTLDDPEIPDPKDVEGTFSDFDRKPFLRRSDVCNAHARDILINRAVDENLMGSMWNIILNRQSSRSLESLRFINTPMTDYVSALEDPLRATAYYLPDMIRSYHVTAACHGGTRFEIRELRRVEWENIKRRSSPILNRPVKGIFNRVWPLEEGVSEDWRERWCSRPFDEE
ncbi:hypothetical protein FQN50_001632 [Emmonsiellopsis sp. PD_5]|nr:hypothetical protein FQN50_001632 [Emmonsiellopsis sp. PD_5]